MGARCSARWTHSTSGSLPSPNLPRELSRTVDSEPSFRPTSTPVRPNPPLAISCSAGWPIRTTSTWCVSLPSEGRAAELTKRRVQIKQHQLLGGAHPQYERMYTEAIDSAHEHLIRNVEVVPGREDLMIVGEQARASSSALDSVYVLTRIAGLGTVEARFDASRLLCGRNARVGRQAPRSTAGSVDGAERTLISLACSGST